MIQVIISEKGAQPRRLHFDKPEVFIGRVDQNDIVLAKGNVSKQHTKLVLRDGRIVVVDLKSTNGTFVNGKRIAGPLVVKAQDKIAIGDFTLAAEPAAAEAEADAEEEAPAEEENTGDEGEAPAEEAAAEEEMPAEEAAAPEEEAVPEEEEAPPSPPPRKVSLSPKPSAKAASPAAEGAPKAKPPARRVHQAKPSVSPEILAYAQLQKAIHDALIEYLDLRRLDIDKLGDQELWDKTDKAVRDIIGQMDTEGEFPNNIDREEIIRDVMNEALGLGPLEELLADDEVSEIMVNHAQQVYVERKGKLTLSHKIFSSNQAVLGVIERIVAPIGRRIDESSPLVDARLKDGSRVNAIIPPLALKGPSITIRKFAREKLEIEDLIKFKSMTAQMAEFLEMCVTARRNIVISGGTGSGKTTLLNVTSSFIPEDERIVTVEDAAELQLHQDHWIQLESRPPNLEGKGQITIRDLVKNCLRMRPDRIVIGECRGGEALDMLQAMNTGHDGSLTTLHANTPRDALSRMETLVLMSGMELPIKAIREQIASAVNIIVQQTRFGDGSRKVTAITEVAGMEVDVITLQDIFYYKQEGFDKDGKIKGRFIATGFVPKFYEDMQRRGLPVNMNIFREE
ncbi:MAG TPA: ATPase, T2SS/T4P/T4SS family [Myxococcales bacterium]|nr:ATPase, T2SS/T4P/T4SS family [Myxococcales bacterium]